MFFRCSLALALLALLLQLPLSDVDLFTQLRLGAEQLSSGALYRHELLVAPHVQEAVVNPGWLFQIIASWFAENTGLGFLHLVHAALALLAFELMLWSQRPSPLARLAACLLAFLVAQSNLVPRPQVIALLGFAGAYAILNARISLGRKLLLAVPLMLFWQNCHPSLSLILVLCLGIALRDRSLAPAALLCGLLSLVCGLLTPDGGGLAATSSYNVFISRFLGITEWLPPWHAEVVGASAVFWASLPLSIYMFAKRRGAWQWLDLVEVLIFLALSLWATRFIVFFALVMLPLWARLFDSFFAAQRPKMEQALTLVPAILGVMLLFRVQTLDPNIPIAEIQQLRSERPTGIVYNYREWAGPLAYFGSSRWQFRIDGRLYLYPQADWENYYAEARGEVPLEVIEATYSPSAFFLHPDFSAGLIELLRGSQKWREISSSSEAVAFVSTP